MIRFNAPTTWYQNNFNLTRCSRTLAMGERLLSTLYSIPSATWIYVIDFKRCKSSPKSSFRSTWIEVFKSAGTLLEIQTNITPSISPKYIPRLFKFSSPSFQECALVNCNAIYVTIKLCYFWVSRYFSKMLTSWKRRIWGERHVILINVLMQASKRNFVYPVNCLPKYQVY